MRLCSGGKRWAGVCPTSTEGIMGGGRPGDGYRHPEAWTCETDHPPRGEEAWLRGVPGSRAGPARPPGRSILNSKQGDLPGVLVCSYACCPPACTAPPSSLLPEQPANTHTRPDRPQVGSDGRNRQVGTQSAPTGDSGPWHRPTCPVRALSERS